MPEVVKEVTRYSYKGQLHDGLNDILSEVENQLGKVVDRICIDGRFGPKERRMVFEGVLQERSHLLDLLSIEVEVPDQHGQFEGTKLVSLWDGLADG